MPTSSQQQLNQQAANSQHHNVISQHSGTMENLSYGAQPGNQATSFHGNLSNVGALAGQNSSGYNNISALGALAPNQSIPNQLSGNMNSNFGSTSNHFNNQMDHKTRPFQPQSRFSGHPRWKNNHGNGNNAFNNGPRQAGPNSQNGGFRPRNPHSMLGAMKSHQNNNNNNNSHRNQTKHNQKPY